MAGTKLIALNRQVRHEYFVEESLEAGIELVGTEVKSIRQGNVNLKDAWVDIKDGQAYVHNMHISPYEKGNIFNKDPLRVRRLLMHKSEIRNWYALLKKQGYTLVPLSMHFRNSNVKVVVGLCKGKKLYDKRASSASRDAKREMDRAVKSARQNW